METISQRIFDKKFNGVPLEIILAIVEDIERLMQDGKAIEYAIFVATGRAVKKYAGKVPASAPDRVKWIEGCVKIGEEVYAMCTQRFPQESIKMLQDQAMAAAYRGIIDNLIEKLASYKAKNFAIDED